MKEFKTDDCLAFAINQAIGDLQNIVKDLPQGATTEEQVQTIKQTDTVVYTLISSVDDIEREIVKDEKCSNYIEKLIDDTNKSHPVRVRGLKFFLVLLTTPALCVAPRAGAWIEM